MSQITTLFIVQTAYSRLEDSLRELANLQQAQDAIVLLEDSVLALDRIQNHQLQHLYVLESDAHIISDTTLIDVTIINYAQFANLMANAEKVMTWK